MNDIFYVFRREFLQVFRDPAILTFFVLLPLVYPVVYTYIYDNEVVRDVPVAVVDDAASSLSREFLRLWDASPNVNIVAHCRDMEEAKVLMYRKEVYGVLELPADFSKTINRGDQAHVALFCDMGALLNYKALLQAASDVAILMGKQIQMEGLEWRSKIDEQVAVSPIEICEVKLFNPQGGFASFIIPAVLLLVIQQSLLLGVGTLAGTSRDFCGRMVPQDGHYCSAWRVVVGRSGVYLLIYLVVAYWVFFIVPRMFSLTQIAPRIELMIFLFPFLLSCVFLAVATSFVSKQREQPFLIFVFTSIPLMFISGISWPKEAIADYWILLSKIFPSTHGIDGFVKINNLGASLMEVRLQYISLWVLALLYFLFACWLYDREIKRIGISDK